MPDILIKGGTVLDAGGVKAGPCDVAVSCGRITGVGPSVPGFVPGDVLDASGCVVMPGLINAHTHLYLSGLRGLGDDVSFQEWLNVRISPRENRMTMEQARAFCDLSMLEMIRSGTTCFLDMHMFPGASLESARSSGVRAVLARGIVGESRTDPAAVKRIADALSEAREADQDRMTSVMLAPHAIYTCGEDLLRHVTELSARTGLGVHTHLSESEQETAMCRELHGMSPPAWLDSIGFFDVPVLAAHFTQAGGDDIALLEARGAGVAMCPVSNARLGNGFAPVQAVLDSRMTACLGTDSAASNNTLDMFREACFLSLVAKGQERSPVAARAGRILRALTTDAATALGIDDLGEIKVGSRADIIILDMDRPNTVPCPDPVSALFSSLSSSQVRTSVINGRVVYRDFAFTDIDEREVIGRARRLAAER